MMTMTMTATMKTMTKTMTERRRPRFSVGQRITAGVTLVTVAVLCLVGVVLYAVESAALERRISDELRQEIVEFRALAESGVDPETGEPFESVDRLLRLFLQRNEPAAAETLFGFLTTGTVVYQGRADPQLRESPEFADTVEAMLVEGGTRTATIGGSEYRIVVQPLTEEQSRAAFVVVHDVSGTRRGLAALMGTYALSAVIATVLVTASASFIAQRLLQPVRELRTTAQSITGGRLDRRLEASGSDDLAELVRTFNEMLDRLEAAFETQRQFLDDAGHELRTPLTVLRGHLEVLDPADVDDVEETRALLLDEIARMSRLVDDLLVLAKARRPDFLRTETVDLAVLLAEIGAKATGLADREWRVQDTEPRTLCADPQRLTQALLQLADNAVRHTSPGDAITFGADVSETAAELWVRDTGPGVPESQREAIFQRFARGGSSGAGDDGAQSGCPGAGPDLGAGLGLAIVSAIARAHHGTVSVDPAPADPPGAGPGATFRLRLPLEPGGEV